MISNHWLIDNAWLAIVLISVSLEAMLWINTNQSYPKHSSPWLERIYPYQPLFTLTNPRTRSKGGPQLSTIINQHQCHYKPLWIIISHHLIIIIHHYDHHSSSFSITITLVDMGKSTKMNLMLTTRGFPQKKIWSDTTTGLGVHQLSPGRRPHRPWSGFPMSRMPRGPFPKRCRSWRRGPSSAAVDHWLFNGYYMVIIWLYLVNG